MSKENPQDLVVKSAPHITGTMSKNRLMQYTFVALLVVTAITAILWWSKLPLLDEPRLNRCPSVHS